MCQALSEDAKERGKNPPTHHVPSSLEKCCHPLGDISLHFLKQAFLLGGQHPSAATWGVYRGERAGPGKFWVSGKHSVTGVNTLCYKQLTFTGPTDVGLCPLTNWPRLLPFLVPVNIFKLFLTLLL